MLKGLCDLSSRHALQYVIINNKKQFSFVLYSSIKIQFFILQFQLQTHIVYYPWRLCSS